MEEAVEAALGELGLTEQEADVEVVQEPRSGLFGVGAQEAIVVVRPRSARRDEELTEFDGLDRAAWHYTERDTERKYSTEEFRSFGPTTRALFYQVNASLFLWFLEQLTGVPGLIPDPHLRGGGLHEIKRGGALGVHADFNFYQRLNLYRRLNLLVYLNENWQEAWGGELELWDRTGTRCVQRISPVFNRAVIFDTSNFSYHGHPRPLQCPEERSRKSLALYYYTVDAPADDDRTPHTTVFVNTQRGGAPESAHRDPAGGAPVRAGVVAWSRGPGGIHRSKKSTSRP